MKAKRPTLLLRLLGDARYFTVASGPHAGLGWAGLDWVATHAVGPAVAVQLLGACKGTQFVLPSTDLQGPYAGLDWVAAHAVRPAVATLSLGLLGGAWSRTLDAAATALVRDHNVTLVAAAGNGRCPKVPVAPTWKP